MSDPNQDHNRRHSDGIVVALNQKFSDFVERYDRDVGALNEWRKNIDETLKEQDDILKDIAPAYKRGLWVVGLIVAGSVGMVVKAVWAHLKWNG